MSVRVNSRGPQGIQGETGADGPEGPSGDTGAAGGSLTRTADGAVSGHRVVRATGSALAAYCDSLTLDHINAAIGITTDAASSGDPLTVIGSGEITEGSWSWTAGLPIFCGPNGVLTQTYDGAWAWSRVVAIAETPTQIFVQLREPIAL